MPAVSPRPPSAASGLRFLPARPAQPRAVPFPPVRASAPNWARRLRSEQTARHHGQTAMQASAKATAAAPPPIPTSRKRRTERCNSSARCSATAGRPSRSRPTRKPAQLWDERIGSARVQARNWRLMALGGLRALNRPLRRARLAIAAEPGRAVCGRGRPARRAARASPADKDYQPTDPQIAWHLAHFISRRPHGLARSGADACRTGCRPMIS